MIEPFVTVIFAVAPVPEPPVKGTAVYVAVPIVGVYATPPVCVPNATSVAPYLVPPTIGPKVEIIDMLKRAYLYSNKLQCCGNCSWLYLPSCTRKKAGSFDHITLYNNLFPEPSACCGAWHMKLIQGKEDV